MHKRYIFSQLDESLLEQYREAVRAAFPTFVLESPIGKKGWPLIEQYFPQFQVFLVDNKHRLIGFINALPIFLSCALVDLPQRGWDWLVQKGITDHEQGLTPNCLGGLQIIVCEPYRRQGFSRNLISLGKDLRRQMGWNNFIIPIRPTLKHKHQDVCMEDYLKWQKDGQIYDPWIRTHVACGAQIIKVCKEAMHTPLAIDFWEETLDRRIEKSGYYHAEGALNPIYIDCENGRGAYWEENVWINYQQGKNSSE